MKKLLFVFTILFLIYSCDKNDEGIHIENDGTTMEEDIQALSVLSLEILTLAESVQCNDPGTWKFIATGSKPCGGPMGYLAYSTTMGPVATAAFLQSVALYNAMHEAFNIKWEIFSDCALVPAPSGVACVDGAAVLIYE